MKKIYILFGSVFLLAGAFWIYWYLHVNPNPYSVEPKVSVPHFQELASPFRHRFSADASLPFLASAIIDAEGDGVPEIFVGGGTGQDDHLLKYNGRSVVDITKKLGLKKGNGKASLGAATIDGNGDGRSDIFVARADGVFVYWNLPNGFQEERLDIRLDAKSTPLSLALADLNYDGAVDIFVSAYIAVDQVEGQTIFNDPGYGAQSRLFLNNGKNHFIDITKQAGLSYVHNTFTAVFVDVDNDRDLDLVVAHDTGTVRTWRNLGQLRFAAVKNPTDNYYSYPMGIAVGDYDNNGLADFFFSNVGRTLPEALLRGDLRDDQSFNPNWILLSNQGNFQFRDAAAHAKLANYGFSWGAVFADLNLDGREDLLVAENYIGMPLFSLGKLPGRVLLQNPDGQFYAAESQSGLVNKFYGITPLLADFNQDHLPDVVFVNIDGPLRVFLQEKPASHAENYLEMSLPDLPENIGAVALLREESTGSLLGRQDFIVGEGLCSDQEHLIRFGLGQHKGPFALEVHFADGRNILKTGLLPGKKIQL